jgi:uncharacterized repeat protein (TIGR04138 family)
MSYRQGEFTRPGFVSLWVGTFPSVEEAERYFGIPDEIGVYLPAEAFIRDFGLGDFAPETLEVNFEQASPRPLRELLQDATFSASFIDPAVAAANRRGISLAQGIALLYDFDYRSKPKREDVAGPLKFIGAFPFVPVLLEANLQQQLHDLAARIGYPVGAVLFVAAALETVCLTRRQEREASGGHISAREFCQWLLGFWEEDTAAILREFGLGKSEDVGRVIFELVGAGLVSRQESESEAEFQGLFALE